MNSELDHSLFLEKLRARWPVVAGSTLLVAAAALLYTVTNQPEWEARSSLLVAMNEGMRTPQAPGALAALTQTASPLSLLKGVAVSRRVEAELLKVAPMEPRTMRRIYSVTDLTKENQLILSARSKDREKAMEIVKTAIASMEEIGREIGFSNAQREVKYLEGAIEARTKELTAAQSRLASFQRSMKAPFDPEEPGTISNYQGRLREATLEYEAVNRQINLLRAKARRAAGKATTAPTSIPSVAEWRKRLIEQEYELRIAETTLGPENPRLTQLREQVRITKDTLSKEVSRYLTTIDAAIDPELASLEGRKIILEDQKKVFQELAEAAPTEAQTFSKLLYEVQMIQAALTQLRTAFEQARTNAEVDRVRFSVLDQPAIDPEPTNKNYGRNGSLGAILGLILGALVVAALPLRKRSTPQ
ncbi:MAG: Wzz/FepE/Etk N-terminal domain-containing protein [Fimbriimonadaceae bacterium]|jgi:uncharacterized protein involved in exopolysaccharide biosynthesis|nr:Wzz/FepE/Etk N-terminal domain-containing protein [Fimbriimonadaceae bacterium]